MEQWIIRSQVLKSLRSMDAVQRPNGGGGSFIRALKIWSDSVQKCNGRNGKKVLFKNFQNHQLNQHLLTRCVSSG